MLFLLITVLLFRNVWMPQGTSANATTTVQLTAVATPVIAAISGPQGDVLSANPIAFTSAAFDPDAAATPSAYLVRWARRHTGFLSRVYAAVGLI